MLETREALCHVQFVNVALWGIKGWRPLLYTVDRNISKQQRTKYNVPNLPALFWKAG